MKATLLIFSLLILSISAKTLTEDEITVPGWPEAYKQHFKVSSGFLDSADGKSHYMFLTKIDAEKPENEPIVLWLNGGKGCSSLQGLFQEMGPFRMIYPKETFPATYEGRNKFAWNNYANLLFIEAPLKTGFSTSNQDEENYHPGDEKTVEELMASLTYFFNQNPTYNNKQKFILAGEGLAGQYIPLLAQKIIEAKNINLVSVVLGNAMLADNQNADFWEHYHSLEFLDEHGLYGPQMDKLWYKCVSDSLTDPSCEYFQEKNQHTKVQLNPYNFYADCQNKASQPKEFEEDESENAYCMNWQPLEKYMTANKATFGDENSKSWQVCHPQTQQKYINLEGGSFNLVLQILEETDVKVILYNGLSDSTVPYFTTEQYYHDLKRKLKAEEILTNERFVNSQGQVGGWNNACKNFQYLKVRAAGHQVPTDQPSSASEIIQAAINDYLIGE